MVSRPITSKKRWVAIVCGCLLLATDIPLSLAISTLQESNQAPAFTLQDQHEATHHYQFPRPKISVLILADYEGSSQLESWIQSLYDRYRERIAIDGVADLSKVPRLFRGMVRSAFRDRLARPVLLDWSGAVSEDYHYQKGEANLFVIDPKGGILLKEIGAANDTKLQRVQQAIDRHLNRHQP